MQKRGTSFKSRPTNANGEADDCLLPSPAPCVCGTGPSDGTWAAWRCVFCPCNANSVLLSAQFRFLLPRSTVLLSTSTRKRNLRESWTTGSLGGSVGAQRFGGCRKVSRAPIRPSSPPASRLPSACCLLLTSSRMCLHLGIDSVRMGGGEWSGGSVRGVDGLQWYGKGA